MGEERRQAPRIPLYLPIQFRQRSGELQVIETLIKDLSVGGLRCVSPAALPPAVEVSVELPLVAGEEPLTAGGRVVWVQPIPQSEQFELGIAFLSLAPETKRRLSTYLERCSRHLVQV